MDNIVVWFGLAVALPFWFLQNVIHESSHILIPALKGCEVKIYPYPKRANGRWYMALSTWQCATAFPKRTRLYITAMPRIVNLWVVVLVGLVTLIPMSTYLYTLLTVFQICAGADFTANTLGIFYPPDRKNDAWRTVEYAEIQNVRSWKIGSVLVTLAVAATVLWTMFR